MPSPRSPPPSARHWREWTGADALQEALGATRACLFGQLSTWHLSLSLTSKPSWQTVL